ncbi:SDR family NAD(P)-dependent oxidoreductase [Actinopolymorpha alba]|uniref:SDR family NAD(P)-dependent oxidoreductase n=1 Tax=Actinopolymorpha alba TaxID=533267 RepID=UPI000382965E|nr:SDR family NAD(P)-dependent oxidoreductase [Actinopolymorpha alba]
MELDLSGKSALVTGGATGIGRGVALALAAAGADVAVTYRSHDGAQVAKEIADLGRRSAAYELDATDSGQVDQVIDEAAAALGGQLTILVNNAGGLIGRTPIATMTDEHWHQVIDVNLFSAFACSRSALRHLPDNGRIINISSLAARNGGGRGAVAYAAAKAGMHGLTRGLAKELGPRGITVNAVAPGLILDTPFHEAFTPAAEQQAAVDSTPLRRAGFPDDVAGAVLYLASDLGAFTTGAVLDLNGGTYFS